MTKRPEHETVLDVSDAMNAARDDYKSKGRLDAIVDFGRLATDTTGRQAEVLEGLFDVDLDDCDPWYAKAYVRTWNKLYTMIGGQP